MPLQPLRGLTTDESASAAAPTQVRRDRGVALILVMFIVALATILVVNLTYSSYIGSRLNKSAERSLQAEYLLKSALNLARILLQSDPTNEDSPTDPWALFRDGAPVPAELLGIAEPNLRIALEIRPENAKLNVRMLRSALSTNTRDRDIFRRLYERLGFDTDGELDRTGLVPEREFDSAKMIANLIDYMDSDRDSLSDGDFQGVESQFGTNEIFPNQEMTRLGEMSAIPGFTPLRVQRQMPFVTANPQSGAIVNINFAPREVLLSLSPNISEGQVDSIISFRDGPDGPFKSGDISSQLTNVIGDPTLVSDLLPLLTDKGDAYQVIAKVDYETSVYFLRSYVLVRGRGPGASLPDISSIELF